jgi:hypothetical protein
MIIAIDPGASGAIAWCQNSGLYVHVIPMPETRRDTIDAIKKALGTDSSETSVCYHEKIAPFIPDGGASMMFSFGANVERCGCIVETLGIRLIEVPPKTWQKALGLGSSDRMKVPAKGTASIEEIKAAKEHNRRAKSEWKNKLKEESQRRFPNHNVTLKTCDALLILEFARINEVRS